MRTKNFKYVLVMFALLAIAPMAVMGQDACTSIVQQALNQAATVCANLDVNSACYGAGDVAGEFDTAEGEEEVAWEVGSRVSLDRVVSLTGSAYDGSTLSVVVVNAQYNLPSAFPEFATALMVGDVTVTNDVARADAFSADALSVRVAQTTDLLRFPPNFGDAVSRVVGVAASGETYEADAISADGAFVRVSYEFQEVGETKRRATAWVSVDSLEGFDASALSVLTPDTYAPFQNLTVVVGAAGADCAAAENVLFVGGPEDVKTEFSVNGADLTIASTVAFLPNGVIVVLDGSVEVTLSDGTTITVGPGTRITPNADGSVDAEDVDPAGGAGLLQAWTSGGLQNSFGIRIEDISSIGASGVGR